MTRKIRVRLMLYFAGMLVIFSLIISAVFVTLFSLHNLDVYKKELEKRAVLIADSLQSFYQQQADAESSSDEWFQQGPDGKGPSQSFGIYLRFLQMVSPTDIWIADQSGDWLYCCNLDQQISLRSLPEGGKAFIQEALAGKTAFGGTSSPFYERPSVSVAAPIYLSDEKKPAGAVLLFEQIDNVNDSTKNGLLILLISMGAAILLSSLVTRILAERFTRPLRKMNETARLISRGEYDVQTGVDQDDEIGQLARSIDYAAVRLREAAAESAQTEKIRRNFVANISHELRTPVTVIRGSLEAICDGVVRDGEQVDEYHKQMLSESIYMERLVNDLLDLARLQNTEFSIEKNNVNLKATVDDAVRTAERLARKRDVTVEKTLPEHAVPFLGDYGRLRQMILIVLDNAIKFSPRGETVRIKLEESGGARLSVADHGCGISEEDRTHLFERFYKQRSEANKEGTGLGLSIAKQIADRHGIKIQYTSSEQQGTTVIFHFPPAEKAEEAGQEASASRAGERNAKEKSVFNVRLHRERNAKQK